MLFNRKRIRTFFFSKKINQTYALVKKLGKVDEKAVPCFSANEICAKATGVCLLGLFGLFLFE